MQKPEFVGDRFSGKIPFNLPRFGMKLPGKVRGLITLVLALLVLWAVVYFSCFVYVEPNEFGIKEIKVGVHRGIEDKVYAPGLWFVMPFGLAYMHRFPRDVQVLELTDFPGKPGPAHYYDKAAKIQTSDGFYVDVDATILYRIKEPLKVIRTLGRGRFYLENGILPKAEPILKQAFGELTTEEFYVSPQRVAKAEMARDLLDAELTPKGIRVEHVLVRYFKYSDEIQQNIEAKKLQDQLVFKNISEAKAAKEEANLKRVRQEGEMNVLVTLEGGEAYKVKKEAERDLYVRKKEAEADLLVRLAEARRTELENEAMQVAGADKMVAMEMAEVLRGLDTAIIPTGGANGLNPLDLDQVIEIFGVHDAGSATILEAAPAAKPSAPPPSVPPPAPAPPAEAAAVEQEVVQ